MASSQRARLEALFHEAAALADLDRAAFLDKACANEPELRVEVESLLAACDSGGGFSDGAFALAAGAAAKPVRAWLTAGDRIGLYTVLDRLGEGGMGTVYRARDAKLRREVALKVLPSNVADDRERLARFEREARLLAALNHPNIAAIYGLESARVERTETESADGVPARVTPASPGPTNPATPAAPTVAQFLVLELVRGGTLADQLARGPLPLATTLSWARQIVDALNAAHENGIVHRDLKPANVALTSDGMVKVLDFGLAKSTTNAAAADGASDRLLPSGSGRRVDADEANPAAVSRFASGAPTVGPSLITQPHVVMGTAAYMSPEQARGETVDKRADIWAFGCVLFEMLTGRSPFERLTITDTLAAIVQSEPDWATLPADTPPMVTRLLRRCLEKDRRNRLRDIGDARADLQALGDTSDADGVTGQPPAAASRSRTPLYLLASVAGLALLGNAFLLSRSPAATAVGPSTAPAASAERLIAVLPFSTIGEGEGYVADGVTEAVARELGRVGRLRVLAPNTAFAYRQRPDEIHKELGVALLVQGSVQRSGETIRVNTSLVDAARATTLWSERYDRAAVNVLAIQDDIAWQVATHLAMTVGSAAPARPAGSAGTNANAYDAYLKGLAHMRGRSSLTNTDARLSAAISEFARAAALDPNFALAHAMLASANTQRFFYDATDVALEQNAFVEIEKALALNPDQAEAFLARAQLVWNVRNGFQHERAVTDLKRAIAINPSLAEAHVELGKVYYHIGLFDKAIAENDEALRLDPLATIAARRRLGVLVDARRFGEVREELARNPRWLVPTLRAEALLALDDASAALAVLTTPPGGRPQRDTGFRDLEPNTISALAYAYAKLGRRAEAEKTLATAIPLVVNPTGLSDIHHAQFAIGCAYALLGDSDTAVRWLTKAAEEGLPSYPKFIGHVEMGLLKGHPAFEALLDRLRRDWERWNATL